MAPNTHTIKFNVVGKFTYENPQHLHTILWTCKINSKKSRKQLKQPTIFNHLAALLSVFQIIFLLF